MNGASPPSTLFVSPGAALNIQLTGTPGNPTDWLALALSASPNTNFLTWAYLNGTTTPPANGVTSASFTITLPTTAGIYELRLFANNGYSRLATGSTIAASSTPPTGSIGLTSPLPGTTFVQPSRSPSE